MVLLVLRLFNEQEQRLSPLHLLLQVPDLLLLLLAVLLAVRVLQLLPVQALALREVPFQDAYLLLVRVEDLPMVLPLEMPSLLFQPLNLLVLR